MENHLCGHPCLVLVCLWLLLGYTPRNRGIALGCDLVLLTMTLVYVNMSALCTWLRVPHERTVES